MTSAQRQCLLLIQRYIAEHGGVSPSYDEIAADLGAQKSRVHALVHALMRQGYIAAVAHSARSIRVVTPIDEIQNFFVWNEATQTLEPYRPKSVLKRCVGYP